MLMKGIRIIVCLLLFCSNSLLAQDAAITSEISPNNGCELTSSETIGVVILNNSSVLIPSGSIEVSYSINGAVAVQQTLNTNLSGGATWNFNFTVAADLSNCQEHEVVAWVDLATDSNPNNDTLTWTVQNDCNVQPGEAVNDLLVCETANEDTINLVNSLHGYLGDWVFSTDNGSTWQSTGQNDTSYVFNNLNQETIFAMAFDGGFCDNDTSDFALVELQPVPSGGEIDGATSVCATSASGTMELINVANDVVHWEFSTDEGLNWDTITNATNTENYVNLIETTWYRTSVEGGVCPDVYSDTAIIVVDTVSIAGTLVNDTLICPGTETELFISDSIGDVVYWEYSEDGGINWNNISHTDTNYLTGALNQESLFRVIVQNGVCPEDTSNSVLVEIENLSFAGILENDTIICPEEEVELFVSDYNGSIEFWEYSEDGGTNWNIINHTDSNYNTGNLNTESLFRSIVQFDDCPEDTTNIVIIEIAPLPSVFAGGDQTIEEGETTTLNGFGGEVGVWTPGTGLSDSTITEPAASPSETTLYTYTAMSIDGCTDSDSVLITVTPGPDPFSIKNVITANNDGYNDSWIIEGIEQFPNTRVSVFNIYGVEVFKNDNYQNDWSGTYNGDQLPNGTYMYIVEPSGEGQIKGTLTILGNE